MSKRPRRSRYDEIHDRYLPDAGRKAGTRYERLMAVVQAGLESASAVVHDSRLRGNVSDEPHQIDVLIEDQAGRRRVLIECKDFDIRGSAVGIGIVRDFHGVVADLQPDEAWIVSCNGFTKPARRWAKAFGIKLATLREFRETDWEGRVRTIIVNLVVRGWRDLSLSFESSAQALAPLIGRALGTALAPTGPGAVGGHPRDVTFDVINTGVQMSLKPSQMSSL